jgi:hypothetical protein
MSMGYKDRVILAAELLHMDPDVLLSKLDPGDTWGWYAVEVDRRPAPEGMQVFAHWSAMHTGINVEIDAPDGLPLTVHVNDWQAVNVVIGTYDAVERIR